MPATPSRRRPASQSQCVSWLLPRKWILALRSRAGNRRVVPFVVGFFTDVLEPGYKQFCAWVQTALLVASASGRVLKHPWQAEARSTQLRHINNPRADKPSVDFRAGQYLTFRIAREDCAMEARCVR